MRYRILTVTLAAFTAGTVLAADASAGKAIYDRACKTCHGADGTANPSIAKMMKVEIKDLKSPEVQSMSNADLKKVITGGTGKMKPVSSVSDKEADDVIAYIHTLEEVECGWGRGPASRAATQTKRITNNLPT